ncbi:MAG: NAD(+) synthase [Bacteroidetes bacterium GWF2_38_335]|nr:MAG: NAD(+) synthase [Bacteroidetes bacterium GWF2_38_335]OFY77192.1 MAG: NAD(+) synthase [Bacteroidetes bacterium RIFOXYA12_FULL_38_20]HBS85808.1 NAD(+) synthase [Bacteroidales bacterium]
MDYKKASEHIINWLKGQLETSGQKGFVVGVSGGIDSAVVSSLCARTGFPVIVLNMPIYQVKEQFSRAEEHIANLLKSFNNVRTFTVDLTNTFQMLCDSMPDEAKGELALVNTRSRLRMTTLYSFANTNNYLVCGTGNKIEDFGIGFFTKYGDGGVDISPIADLLKSQVYGLGRILGVPESILKAPPTDGLWEIDRTDEDQIGASYDELEWAMAFLGDQNLKKVQIETLKEITDRQKTVLKIYISRNLGSQHKMKMPAVCVLPEGM